ncbi:hypothetical protein GUJ93_ZPchr0011g27560 [Zizania palustris]|uniref:Uncharacterized protein n=1 Tax=Zizania palustris TaxID=103762 RepID=A0A8J6BS65_ZIZPA|nr:hypothetical protein GUJ93_ZPchr0011g27560 [Zizania palustris]
MQKIGCRPPTGCRGSRGSSLAKTSTTTKTHRLQPQAGAWGYGATGGPIRGSSWAYADGAAAGHRPVRRNAKQSTSRNATLRWLGWQCPSSCSSLLLSYLNGGCDGWDQRRQ